MKEKKNIKKYKKFVDESYKHYDIDDKLKTLKAYINILKNDNDYIENVDLVDDDKLKPKSTPINFAINYFIILHNFLIIERMFFDIVKLSNKEINKYLNLEKISNTSDILNKFSELYDNHGKIRFAIETFDSIEEIKNFLNDNQYVYNKLM